MKKRYVRKKFMKSTLEAIEQANDIIEEYQIDDLDLTLRQLYYQFVTLGEDRMEELGFPEVKGTHNNERSYKRMGSIVSDARLAGLIDWYAIVDRTRALQERGHWKNPGQIVRSACDAFMVDRWENQPNRLEVWIEKEALTGVISGVCREMDVPYFACKGYTSQSEMWKAAMRMREHDDNGQLPVIIHLGDHDPSGMDMTRDILDRHSLFGVETVVDRIALNYDQIEEYNPPPNPAKLTDSRAKDYIKEFGSSSWELDALEPRMLQKLIRETIQKYVSQDILDDILKKELKYKGVLENIANNWESL